MNVALIQVYILQPYAGEFGVPLGDGAMGLYRGTAPLVLARLAVCSDDASKRWLERFDARALMVRRIR